MLHEAHDAEDLVLELLRRAVDVGVVLGEVAHAEEAVQHAAHLVAVHLAELGRRASAGRGTSAGGSCRSSRPPGQFMGFTAYGFPSIVVKYMLSL